MLLFSLSLPLSYLLNPRSLILLISSSVCFLTNLNRIHHHILLIFIDRFEFILMLQTKLSSSSSKTTFAFDTSSNDKNFNQNAIDIDESHPTIKKSLHRLVQSSTDIKINELHSFVNQDNSLHKNRAIRIESALLTTDYSHLLKHPSQSIINMNKTIDRLQRNGAGDENLSIHANDKQVQTSIRTDHTHYLTLEQVPISNRRTIQFTSKQLILISISVFVFVTFLCLVTISLFF